MKTKKKSKIFMKGSSGKRHIKKIGIALMFSVGLFSSHLSGQTIDKEALSKEVDVLFKKITSDISPGAAVIIIKDGKPILKKCYGLAEIEQNIPVSSLTSFNLASVSKQFTAFSILLLEKEGKINLEDDIHKYIPDLPDYTKTVTVRNLLYQTSGIWDYYDVMTTFCGYNEIDHYTFSEVLHLLKRQKELLFEPGSSWVYSNTNYILLSKIVEKVTGMPFPKWVRDTIFEPLEMKNTLFIENSSQMIPNRAGHYGNGEGKAYNYGSNWVDFCGHSHLYSNLEDMAKWMDNFRTKKIGGESVVSKMFQKGRLNDGSESIYGYGVGVLNRYGKNFIQHSGSSVGYKTFMLYCPDLEFGITILGNDDAMSVDKLGYFIFDIALGKKPIPVSQPNETVKYINYNRISASNCSGGYLVEGLNAKVAVNAEETFMHCAFFGLGEDDFFQTADYSFANLTNENKVEFHDFTNSLANKATLSIKEGKLAANRIPLNEKNIENCLKTSQGNYYCDTFGTVYTINVKDNRLAFCHKRYNDMNMVQIDQDEFFFKLGFIKFKRDQKGEIDGFVFTPSSDRFAFHPVTFKKV